ncbi:MAG TPA: hypothetical protein VMY37_11360 [Thermoguttaceae bacterium]|nr:hypothetical protein [Thermoguttaceae bacterium]
MDNRYRISAALLIALIVTTGWEVVWAQEPPAAEKPEPEGAVMEKRESPAVEAILATRPSTPRELVRSAKILADLERPDLAKGFLNQVLSANLDQQQLVALQGLLGAGLFREMASRADLAPEAQQLNEAVLTAVSRHLQDPARLAGLIKQLQDPAAEVRQQALVELERSGAAAVGPLLAVLADPARAAEHGNVRAALARLGGDAVDPLIAILESGNPKLTVEAIGLLAKLQAEKAAVFLLAPFASDESAPEVRRAAESALLSLSGKTPSRHEALQLLAQRAQEYFDGRAPLREDLDGQVQLWTWDAGAKQVAARSAPADEASRLLASRLAREAYSVAPDDHGVRVLYLATMLEQAAYENGLDKPLGATEGTLAGRVAECGPEIVEDVLVYALRSGHAPAATVAARVLGEIGHSETLLCQGPRPSALAQAAWNADRRVRLAAVHAILRLEPIEPFPGSSRVTEALVYFAGSGGTPRALVAGPSTEEDQRVGGYLVALGYQVDTAVNGREVVRKLLASPDYELALVDAALERPTVDFLLQQLRRDCRTAKLPVGVTAREGQLERARLLVRNDPLGEAFSRPHTQEAVQWQVAELMDLAGPERVLPAERQRQAAWAMKWLAELTGREKTIYDLRCAQDAAIAALLVPHLAPDAVRVLANLGTPRCQRALVDLASRWTQPMELRLAATQAFRQSTEQNGILLTTEQILQQYDRYNRSENLDTGTRQLLGLLLNCIEAPTQIGQQEESAAGDE